MRLQCTDWRAIDADLISQFLLHLSLSHSLSLSLSFSFPFRPIENHLFVLIIIISRASQTMWMPTFILDYKCIRIYCAPEQYRNKQYNNKSEMDHSFALVATFICSPPHAHAKWMMTYPNVSSWIRLFTKIKSKNLSLWASGLERGREIDRREREGETKTRKNFSRKW